MPAWAIWVSRGKKLYWEVYRDKAVNWYVKNRVIYQNKLLTVREACCDTNTDIGHKIETVAMTSSLADSWGFFLLRNKADSRFLSDWCIFLCSTLFWNCFNDNEMDWTPVVVTFLLFSYKCKKIVHSQSLPYVSGKVNYWLHPWIIHYCFVQ